MHTDQKVYVVTGVCCASEEGVLRKRLDATVGAGRYSFSLINAELRVDARVAEGDVLHEVSRAGFAGRSRTALVGPESFRERHGPALVTGAAAILAVAGAVTEALQAPDVVSRTLLLVAIATGGWQVALKAFAAVKNHVLDMNVLMLLAVGGALAIDRWNEGAAVIVLFAVALMLEKYSVTRTRRAVQSLVALAPEMASVVREGAEVSLSATDVLPGDILVIRPGERIPIDGVVVEGQSFVDQATITGESLPVEATPGGTVFGGTLNGRGALRIRAARRYEETTLARIIHRIEEAEQQRAPVQSFIDWFAAWYTPAILAAAVVVALLPPLLLAAPFTPWLYRALVLLVIACPCALVISTPVTLVSALTNGARRGILIKGGKHLEQLSRVRAIAFDKTGTLTEGRLHVTDVLPLDGVPRADMLRILAALEQQSEHPLSTAIRAAAAAEGILTDALRIEGFHAIPGRGVAADVNGVPYALGNCDLCRERNACTPAVEAAVAAFARDGKTTAVLCSAGRALGVIALRDRVRTGGREAILKLSRFGIRKTLILSGDHEAAARQTGREAGVQEWIAHLLPDEKVAAVEKLKRDFGAVAMVGDGINDAPALAMASVGIAMGVAGSDTALETADVVLMSDDLQKLPHLFGLSRQAMRIIRQNILLALTLKGVFLILSVTGFATLWMAVLADDGAALIVILNGLRMLTFALPED